MSLDIGQQEQSYQLLTSTRYDPFLATLSWNNDHDGPCSFFLLPYHFDRLTSAAKTHKWDHTAMFSYDSLKSTCLDAISKEQQQNKDSSNTAFRVNLYHISPVSLFFLLVQVIFATIDSNYIFTRWSNRRDCKPFNNILHIRSHFAIN